MENPQFCPIFVYYETNALFLYLYRRERRNIGSEVAIHEKIKIQIERKGESSWKNKKWICSMDPYGIN